jgi:hypothetical protein
MKIKPQLPRSVDELEKISQEKAKEDNAIKQANNRKFLGNLHKPLKNDKDNRFHLPVLNLNDPTQWPSQPLENRLKFTDEVALHTCLGNCCGVEGLKAACCHLDPDDLEHVLGPVTESWITEIVNWLNIKGIKATRSDVVIDFDEGKLIGQKFFTGERQAVFSSKESYPMLRFQIDGPRFSCKFLNPISGKCSIYIKRPEMCKGYLCQYIKANFFVKSDPINHPNTYKKIR